MPGENTQLIRFLRQENLRLQDENELLTDEVRALRRYVASLQTVQRTVQYFTPEEDILALLDDTLECAMQLLDVLDGSLILVDEETDELVFVLVRGTIQETLPGHRFDRHLGIAGWAVEHQEPVIANNVVTDARFFPSVDERFGFSTRSLLAVPLIARGKAIGVLELVNKRSGEPFTEEDADLLGVLATLSASALDYAATCHPEGTL
jgi:GAF domain-containing protein